MAVFKTEQPPDILVGLGLPGLPGMLRFGETAGELANSVHFSIGFAGKLGECCGTSGSALSKSNLIGEMAALVVVTIASALYSPGSSGNLSVGRRKMDLTLVNLCANALR